MGTRGGGCHIIDMICFTAAEVATEASRPDPLVSRQSLSSLRVDSKLQNEGRGVDYSALKQETKQSPRHSR